VWFEEVVPGLAVLLLRLPSLLEAHYCKSNKLIGSEECNLRLLGSQDAGIVILNRVEILLIIIIIIIIFLYSIITIGSS
jgi:poly(ADP-ribose) glycohydrolase